MTAASLSGISAAEAGALNANVSASSRVFQELRLRIISLKLHPGAILNRAELAEAFGVSQSPVREAILRLKEIAGPDGRAPQPVRKMRRPK